jgi:uncharacterized membrane-anchored protein YhcB (DUF1043 family)
MSLWRYRQNQTTYIINLDRLLGPWEWIVILVVFGVPVLLIILFARLLLRNKRENVRLRLEVGKLADELEQMRKNAKGNKKDNSSDKSF